MRSIFTVISPAADLQLLTKEELRAAAGVTGDAQDAALEAMGKQVAEAIARDCGVAWDGLNAPTLLKEGCRQVFFTGRCTTSLRLARRPVLDISSLTIDGVELASTDFALDKASSLLWRKGVDWPLAEVAIEFVAGYESAPSSLKLAASKLMTSLWLERTRDPSLRREVVEGVGTMEFWVAPSSDPLLSAEISDLLSPFRERWF